VTQETVPFGMVAQTAPHCPQFVSSVPRSTHTFLQLVVPPVQTAVQTPPAQVWPAPQAVPQAPQFVESVSSRTQALPQGEKGAVHAIPHLPALHTAPPFGGTGQALLQAPQLAAFEVRSTHAPLHVVVPAGHRSTHFPAEQAVFAPHFTPHPPQLFGSMFVATQAAPHLVRFVLQLKSHLPAAHTAVEREGAVQRFPQPPQLTGSEFASTQAVPHRESPVPHALLHAPPAHVAVPPLGAAQAWAHAEQLVADALRSTQAPVHAVIPAGQTVAHLPRAHTSPAAQTDPHAPQ
jgi:hypothetical protein